MFNRGLEPCNMTALLAKDVLHRAGTRSDEMASAEANQLTRRLYTICVSRYPAICKNMICKLFGAMRF